MLLINQHLDKIGALRDYLQYLGHLGGRTGRMNEEQPEIIIDLEDGDDAEVVEGVISAADVHFPNKHGTP